MIIETIKIILLIICLLLMLTAALVSSEIDSYNYGNCKYCGEQLKLRARNGYKRYYYCNNCGKTTVITFKMIDLIRKRG